MECETCKEIQTTNTNWDNTSNLPNFHKHKDNKEITVEFGTPYLGTIKSTKNYKIKIRDNNMEEIDVTVQLNAQDIKEQLSYSEEHILKYCLPENEQAGSESRYFQKINCSHQQREDSKHIFDNWGWETKHSTSIINRPDNKLELKTSEAMENKTINSFAKEEVKEPQKSKVREEKLFGSTVKNGRIVKNNIESRKTLIEGLQSNAIVTELNPESQKENNINNEINESEQSIKRVHTPEGSKLLLTPETGLRYHNDYSTKMDDEINKDTSLSYREIYGKQADEMIKVERPNSKSKIAENESLFIWMNKEKKRSLNTLNDNISSKRDSVNQSQRNMKNNESLIILGPHVKLPQKKYKGSYHISKNSPLTKKDIENQEILDSFTINKNKYLEKLRRESRSRSRISESRTLSRHSLSPECQAITDRLYYSKTNKQPCPKFEIKSDALQRAKMKDTLKDFPIISKYLSDYEIYDAMAELQEKNVCEKKWALKLVDLVYSKLKKIKGY